MSIRTPVNDSMTSLLEALIINIYCIRPAVLNQSRKPTNPSLAKTTRDTFVNRMRRYKKPNALDQTDLFGYQDQHEGLLLGCFRNFASEGNDSMMPIASQVGPDVRATNHLYSTKPDMVLIRSPNIPT